MNGHEPRAARHWVAATPTKARRLEDGRHVGTQAVVARHLTEVARHLGLPDVVTHKQVWAWCNRRRSSGCPEPLPRDVIDDASTGHAPGSVDWFDLSAWVAWWMTYTPARGGAPRGNGNALGRKAVLEHADGRSGA
jgi:hypothetical protein